MYINKTSRSFESKCREIGSQFWLKLQSLEAVSLVYAQVQAVDEDAKTMDAVINDNHVISGISLDVVWNGNNSVLLIPTIDSWCILGFIENQPETTFVVNFTQIDKVILRNNFDSEDDYIEVNESEVFIKRGDTSCKLENGQLSLDSGGTIVMNGGQNDGLVLINDLTTRMNKLVSQVNSFISSYNSHTHSGVQTGGGSSGTTAATATSATTFDKSEYENTKITQ